MLRLVATAAFVALAILPAAGAEWSRYEDPKYGFGLEVPSLFEIVDGTGDSVTFAPAGGNSRLTISGGSVQPGSFNDAWEAMQAAYEADGWTLGYEPVAPHWTSFAGARGDTALFVKMIPLCGGTKQYGMFAYEYPAADGDGEAVALHVAQSMTRSGTGFSC